DAVLNSAAASVPPGRWAIGVSGGADSVALVCLLHGRADLSLRVVHLDHELRGEQSAADARFVCELADVLKVPCTARRLSQMPSALPLPANLSARLRAFRLALFRQVVAELGLQGVLLAHHGDDQADT